MLEAVRARVGAEPTPLVRAPSRVTLAAASLRRSMSRSETSPDAREARPSAPREAPIAMSHDDFRAAGHALVDMVADFLRSVPERPVTRGESPSEIQALLGAEAGLPEHGTEVGVLLRETAELLFDHSLFNGHPKFFGYVTAPPSPIGILGDFLASAVNANVGAWRLAPAATEIEAQTMRWLAELVGFPSDCGGLLVSGGNMANMVALFAARRAAAPWNVQAKGLGGPLASRLCVYASKETHTWIQKACDLSGLGTDAIRWLPTDAEARVQPGALREAIAADRADGCVPMMVVGTAGTVSTGAVDPLFELAAISQEAGAWFHVDGAYGGLAAAIPGTPADLGALKLADSIALDPHKWLYAPLEAGAVLVRGRERLRDAFSYHPPYYHFEEEALNLVDYGPQNSRGFRALKVWLSLRQVGRAGYVRMIEDDMRLSRQLAEIVDARPELELVSQNLSITTFRHVPLDLAASVGTAATDEHLDRLNAELLDRIQRSGEAFVSNAVVDGRYLLRACIVNFHTGPADIAALVDLAVRLGAEVDRELRSADM